MNTKVLYVLTVRATIEKLEEDLECQPITDITEDGIYTNEKKWNCP